MYALSDDMLICSCLRRQRECRPASITRSIATQVGKEQNHEAYSGIHV